MDETTSAVVENTIALPSGIDVSGLINSGLTVLGGAIAIALAAWGGIFLVKVIMKWLKRTFNT